MRCFYLVGYHGCGKTTQANNLAHEFPEFNYIGGKLGLDNVRTVQDLVKHVKSSKTDMIIHGCMYQSEPSIKRLSLLTDLHVIVMLTLPEQVKARTLKRGAADYNVKQYIKRHQFIKHLPEYKKKYNFKMTVIDNNQSEGNVYKQIKECVLS